MLWRIGLILMALCIFKITQGGVLQRTPRETEGEEDNSVARALDGFNHLLNETSELTSMMVNLNASLTALGRALDDMGRLLAAANATFVDPSSESVLT